MRGVALATLFLGLCLVKPEEAEVVPWLRLIIFWFALLAIFVGV
jgi:hypothetical protein